MSIDDAIIFLTDDLPELLKDNPNTTEYVLEAAKMGAEALEEKKKWKEMCHVGYGYGVNKC